jgi:hypothetical protein
MKTNLNRIYVATGLIFCLQHAYAQGIRHSWSCDLSKGDCIGFVKYSVTKTFWRKTKGEFEYTRFKNGDSLAVNRTKEPNTKILSLHDGSVYLYGISFAEKSSEDSLPDDTRTLFNTLLLMINTYPDGIGSMPSVWQSREISYEQKMFDVAVRRLSKTSFDFRYSDNHDWNVSGTWSIERQPSLEDNFSLEGWTNAGPYRTLGEARMGIQSQRNKQ